MSWWDMFFKRRNRSKKDNQGSKSLRQRNTDSRQNLVTSEPKTPLVIKHNVGGNTDIRKSSKTFTGTNLGLAEITKAEKKLAMLPKNLPSLEDSLNDIVFTRSITQAEKDVLRLIRRVKIVSTETKPLRDSNVPENIVALNRSDLDSLYLFGELLKEFVRFFEPEDVANDIIRQLNNAFEGVNADSKQVANPRSKLNVLSLIEICGGDKCKTALAVRCLSQSVAISGYTKIKTQVCPLDTKDYPGEKGWQITVKLEPNDISITHTRRELSAGPETQRWELEFEVFMTFDKQIKAIKKGGLRITDLWKADTMDDVFKQYLDQKFGAGKMVVVDF